MGTKPVRWCDMVILGCWGLVVTMATICALWTRDTPVSVEALRIGLVILALALSVLWIDAQEEGA